MSNSAPGDFLGSSSIFISQEGRNHRSRPSRRAAHAQSIARRRSQGRCDHAQGRGLPGTLSSPTPESEVPGQGLTWSRACTRAACRGRSVRSWNCFEEFLAASRSASEPRPGRLQSQNGYSPPPECTISVGVRGKPNSRLNAAAKSSSRAVCLWPGPAISASCQKPGIAMVVSSLPRLCVPHFCDCRPI